MTTTESWVDESTTTGSTTTEEMSTTGTLTNKGRADAYIQTLGRLKIKITNRARLYQKYTHTLTRPQRGAIFMTSRFLVHFSSTIVATNIFVKNFYRGE